MTADALFKLMTTETLNGVTVNDIVGGGDPKGAGVSIIEVLRRHHLLTPSVRLLDIGCGCGRLAAALTEHLGSDGSYVGVDIIPGLVSFCRREVSSRHPNFSFYAIRENNPAYAKHIKADEADLFAGDLDKLDGTFDLVTVFSVFTHIQRRQAEAMLRTIWRRLRNGGTAVLSFFILDPVSHLHIREGHTFFGWKARLDTPVAWKRKLATSIAQFRATRKNYAVTYDLKTLMKMTLTAGFEGVYAIQYGHWRSSDGLHYQDVVILRKEEPFPKAFDPKAYLAANPDVAGTSPFFHYRISGKAEGRRW